MRDLTYFAWTIGLAAAQSGAVIDPNSEDVSRHASNSLPIDIESLRDNRAFAMSPNDADFDGTGSGYPATLLPDSNLTLTGVNFDFPQYVETGNDNVIASGQSLDISSGRYFSVHMLAASESSIATGYVNATYADNSTNSVPVLVPPYWDWPYPFGPSIDFPYCLTNRSRDYNHSGIYRTSSWLDSSKVLTSLQLPNVSSGAGTDPGAEVSDTRLHIFAVSLVPAMDSGISLEVQYAHASSGWFEGTNKTQIVEVVVNNVGEEWVLANHSVRVTVDSLGVRTVIPGVINRLRPGDQVRLHVGVVNADSIEAGETGSARVSVAGVGVRASYEIENAVYGIPNYDGTYESIFAHQSPMWFNDAKFGIFIHWGVYSVPGWGNVGENETYAEWYWWRMNQGPGKPDQIYEYNLATYGREHVYDDFIQNFTASAYDPKAWVDLFDEAGAQYFVQVSKHHDGYAIFDLPANVTERTSVAQYPHMNLLQMLFDAADQYQPHLHKATYYSLPEWFHPDYAQYGFGQWPGGLALNPYTNETLPYTGHVPVEDYITDVILPEMRTLANMGTEIMWCDIGGPNMTAEFAAEYFNNAAVEGKQVLINNRCGLPGDFATPEYASYDAVQTRKWESNLGMDPYSYGYNRATPDEAYLAPQGIITSLIDIVSKNGNLLLDVGPTANGTIIEIEQRYLREAGQWIKGHGEAIFNTTYWFVTPEEGDAVRFTQSGNAFFIHARYAPNGTLVLDSPVPYVAGDAVTVVGGEMGGAVVPSRLLPNGSLEIEVSEEVVAADQYAWVFKIPFGGVDVRNGGAVDGTTNRTLTPGSGGGPPVATQTSSSAGKTGATYLDTASMAMLVALMAALM